MIARIWRGVTLEPNADKYLAYLNRTVIPLYKIAEGNEGLFVMKACQGTLSHFLLLSLWASEELLEEFADNDTREVNLADEEKSLLVAFESTATNYKIIYLSERVPLKNLL